MRAAVALAVLSCAIAPALAAPVTSTVEAATVDWSRGLVTVAAIGTADRRAPSPAVARVGALREAEARAAAALLAAARALPWAAGGTVGDAVDGDAAALARLTAAAAAGVEVATDRLPDGSVRIERGLPVEAIRQAVSGPRRIAAVWVGIDDVVGDPAAPIVIDARKLRVPRGIGLAVHDGTTTVALPVRLVDKAPRGSKPVAASKLDQGALVVGRDLGLDAAAAAGAVLLVVVSEKP